MDFAVRVGFGAGCARRLQHGLVSRRQRFRLSAFTSHAERGVTTRDQVRAWLGAPPATGVNVDTAGQRFDEWTYYFAEGRMSNLSGSTIKTLQVKFDSKGIVQGWDVSSPPK